MKSFATLRITFRRPYAADESWEVDAPTDPQKDPQAFAEEMRGAMRQIGAKAKEVMAHEQQ